MKNQIFVLFMMTTLGCGGPEGMRLYPDIDIRLVNLDHRPELHAPSTPARVRSLLESSSAWWGGGVKDLNQYTITLRDQFVDCGNYGVLEGCSETFPHHAVDMYAWAPSCIEASVLVHEVGHAIIGDTDHHDPRWQDMKSLWDAILTTDIPQGCRDLTYDKIRLHWEAQ